MNGPDQNAINLSSSNLASPQKFLLSKGPSFVSTPKDVNWYELRKPFTKFLTQIRFKSKQSQLSQDRQNQQELSDPIQSKITQMKLYSHNYLLDKTDVMALCITQSTNNNTNNGGLELFIDDIEKDLFSPKSLVLTRPNISKREQNTLKEIKSWNNETIRIEDKVSRFVILENTDFEQKIKHQIERSSFKQVPQDPSKQFEMKG